MDGQLRRKYGLPGFSSRPPRQSAPRGFSSLQRMGGRRFHGLDAGGCSAPWKIAAGGNDGAFCEEPRRGAWDWRLTGHVIR
jgi:hypothetical protein